MKKSVLIWDLDGTLVDSVVDIASSVNHVLESYRLAKLSTVDVREMIGNGAAKLLQRAFEKSDAADLYESDESYSRFLSHYALHCCENTRLYTGISDVLATYKKLDFKQGVCTNKPVAMAQDIISHLKLTDTFGAIVGGDSTPHRKPHAQPLLKCLELLGADAEAAIMIGDSAADVGVARAAGIPVILLPWGYTPDGIAHLGADYIVEDAGALQQLLHRITG